MARQIARSWAALLVGLRKKIEMLFAHLKRILKLDRLRLRDDPMSACVPQRTLVKGR